PNTTQARGTVTVGTAGHLLRIRCMFPDPSLFGVRRGAERCSSDCHKPTFPGWGELSALSKTSLDPPRHRFQRLTDVPRLPRVVFCSRAGASLALKPEGVSALNGGAARTKASWRRGGSTRHVPLFAPGATEKLVGPDHGARRESRDRPTLGLPNDALAIANIIRRDVDHVMAAIGPRYFGGIIPGEPTA